MRRFCVVKSSSNAETSRMAWVTCPALFGPTFAKGIDHRERWMPKLNECGCTLTLPALRQTPGYQTSLLIAMQ